MINGLVNAGHEVDVLSLNTKKHFVPQAVINANFKSCAKVKTFEINTDIKLGKAFFNLFSNKSYNLSRFWDKDFLKMIQEEVDSNQYDIIQFEGLFVAEYASHITTKVPKVLRQHNIEHQIWERLARNEKNALRAIYLKLLYKRMKRFELSIFSDFQSIIAISDVDSNFLKKHYKKELVTIPVAVKIDRSVPVEKNYIYHIGSMEWLPNKEGVKWFLDQVWNKILETIPSAHFFIAGKGIEQSGFKESKNVTICGEVESLKEFTKDKKLLVVPLLSGGGIRVKILEAMANGKLVVSTTQGVQGLMEGFKIPVSNKPKDFAKEIIDLLQSSSHTNKIIESNYDYIIAHYNEAKLTLRLENLYRSLIK